MPDLAQTKPTEKAFTGELTQAETNYIPLSTTKNAACANCRWFLAYGDCYIVEDEPEPILATGYCNRHETAPEPQPDPTEVLAEAIADVVMDNASMITGAIESMPMMSMEASLGGRKKNTLKERILNLFKGKQKPDDFDVFKGADGKWYWHATHTNNFEDLEQEILTEKAHDAYIARLDLDLVPMPVLEAWHTPGTEHGKALMLWRNGHFVHAVGVFDETPLAEKAIAFYRKNKGKIKLSHGFTAPEWAFDGKHYDDYNTFEISTLPPFAAANPFTSFEEIKDMAMTEEKRRHLTAMFGEETVKQLEAKDTERGKALEEARVAYKDYAKLEPEKPAEKSDTEKALGTLYGELLEGQTEMLNMVKTLATALQSKDTELETLKGARETDKQEWLKQLNEVREQVNMTPARASQSDSTRRTEEEAKTLKDKIPQADALSKWIGLPTKPVEN